MVYGEQIVFMGKTYGAENNKTRWAQEARVVEEIEPDHRGI